MFKNPFSYKGRIRRTEFILSWLISWILEIGLIITFFSLNLIGLAVLLIIPVEIFYHAQYTKRAQDIGWEEKKTFFNPFVKNPFNTISLLFIPGQSKENQYGPNPRKKALH